MVARRKDLTGLKFGRWVVTSYSHTGDRWIAYWNVKCLCGNKKIISAGTLINGTSKSCGCYARDRCIENHTTHGMVNSSEYSSWEHMKSRCLNKKHKHYKYYGGRGIKVCKRWLDFSKFYKDMGCKPTKIHTLDRINSNKNYTKINCRWATRQEQMRNTRQCIRLKWKGRLRCVAEIAAMEGTYQQLLNGRLKLGWSLKRAIYESVHYRGQSK